MPGMLEALSSRSFFLQLGLLGPGLTLTLTALNPEALKPCARKPYSHKVSKSYALFIMASMPAME